MSIASRERNPSAAYCFLQLTHHVHIEHDGLTDWY